MVKMAVLAKVVLLVALLEIAACRDAFEDWRKQVQATATALQLCSPFICSGLFCLVIVQIMYTCIYLLP